MSAAEGAHITSSEGWHDTHATRGGLVRTVAGSAKGPGVSCDVAFSAKSCTCAHRHGGTLNGRVHTRTENKHANETRTSTNTRTRTRNVKN